MSVQSLSSEGFERYQMAAVPAKRQLSIAFPSSSSLIELTWAKFRHREAPKITAACIAPCTQESVNEEFWYCQQTKGIPANFGVKENPLPRVVLVGDLSSINVRWQLAVADRVAIDNRQIAQDLREASLDKRERQQDEREEWLNKS